MSELECPLRSAAVSDPERVALEASDLRLTFRELDEWVEGTASQLRARVESAGSAPPGARRQPASGARVALWMENDWRMVVLLLAAIRAGVVVCPLSTRLPSADAAADQVDAQILISDRAGTAPDVLLRRAREDGTVLHPPEQPATIVFTSGSSGRAKAALLSFGNHYFSALGSNANLPVAPGDGWLVSLPLYHVGGIGILFRCLLGRGTIVLQENLALPDTMSATHLSLVSTQLLRLLRADERPKNLKAVLLGGSAISPGLIEEAVDQGLPIHVSYGMTEMGSQVTTTSPDASLDELMSSGRVLPHRELRVTTDGEIIVRGRTRFLGYVEGENVVEPFDEGGWYATGDVGRLDDGLLWVMGRLDNVFISGGENVMPEEIERILTSRSDIRRAVVVPVEDEEFGYRPVAFVDTGEYVLHPAEMRDWLDSFLPRFKIPIRFFTWPNRDDALGMKVDRAIFEREADKLMRE